MSRQRSASPPAVRALTAALIGLFAWSCQSDPQGRGGGADGGAAPPPATPGVLADGGAAAAPSPATAGATGPVAPGASAVPAVPGESLERLRLMSALQGATHSGGPEAPGAADAPPGPVAPPAPPVETGVTVLRGGKSGPLRTGELLRVGDELSTQATTRASFDLGSARLSLLPASRFRIEGQKQLRVLAGALELETGSDGSPRLNVSGPADGESCEVVPHRARFRAAIDRPVSLDGQVVPPRVLVQVARGQVDLNAPAGKLSLVAGEQGVVRSGRAPERTLAPAGALPPPMVRAINPDPEPAQLAEAPKAGQPPQRGFGTLEGKEPRSGRASNAVSLSSARVNVTIKDGFATTRVDERFYNASGERLEGIYRFPIPRGAVLARLQLEVDGVLRESAVVEKHRARRIFQTIVDEMLDPALAEWSGASQVKLRIYPIEPRSSRRVVLTYVQPLAVRGDRYRYVYPMAASQAQATPVGRFNLDVQVSHQGGLDQLETPLYVTERQPEGEGARLKLGAKSFLPAADFVLEYRPRQPAAELRLAAALEGSAPGAEGYFFAAVHPKLPAASLPRRLDYVIVVDTSYSMAPEHLALARRSAGALIDSLDVEDRFALLACDSFCATFEPGPGGGAGAPEKPATDAAGALGPATEERRKAALQFLAGRRPAGASDIEGALTQAATIAQRSPLARIVYVGDGAASTGELERARLIERVAGRMSRINGPGRSRVLALGIGGDVDELFLDGLARRTGGRAHYVSTGDEVRRAAWELIAAERRPALERVEVSFTHPGVQDLYPRTMPTVVEGDDLFVVGKFRRGAGQGEMILRGELGGEKFERRMPLSFEAQAGSGSEALGRLWAKQRIDHLLVEDDGAEGVRRKEVIGLSTRFGLVTPYTSMLVLENDEMERRFGVRSRRRLSGNKEQIALGNVDGAPAVASAPAGQAPGQNAPGFFGGAAGRGEAAATVTKAPPTSTPVTPPARPPAPAPGAAAAAGEAAPPAAADPAPRPDVADKTRLRTSPAKVPASGARTATTEGTDYKRAKKDETTVVGGKRGRGLDLEGDSNRQLAKEKSSKNTINEKGGAEKAEKAEEADASAARDQRTQRARRQIDDLDNRPAEEANRKAASEPEPEAKPAFRLNRRAGGGSARGPAPAASAPAPKAVAPRPAAKPAAKKKFALEGPFDDGLVSGRRGRPLYRRPPPRRPVPPTARIKVLAQDLGGGGLRAREAGRLASLRAEVARSPLRRAARLRLVQALEGSGQLDLALEAARAWLKLDREHSGAVRAEAAILAALGSGRDTLRAFASLADLAPRDARLHRGLAAMFQAKGEAAAACAHRRALQSLSPSDGEAALGLARCLAGQGEWDEARIAAQAALSSRDKETQREANRLVDDLAVRRPPPEEMPSLSAGLWARDDLVVEARWDGSSDLDVVVRMPSGERLAAHAPQPRGARVSDQRSGGSARSEAVTLRSARAGRYLIEVSRFGAAASAQPVRGEVVLRALRGSRRSIAFELPAGKSVTRVAEVEITPAGWTY